ncbi:MAG: metal-sensitive transcriptional regulator [Candidatus Gracilibacteria bacterium]|nr:metal-sensitive transcriptional regulator [Candidatus Gracilibacteria bacterium]
MIEPYKGKLLTNIKKTKGLLETIQKMIENERYCMDIAQQINAAEGLLKSSSNLILQSHLNSCAAHKLTSKDNKEKEEFIEQLIKVFNISKR